GRLEIRNAAGDLVGGASEGTPLWGRGNFRVELPEGMYKLEVKKGPFYLKNKDLPYFEIKADKPVRADIAMKPWIDLRKMGWYSVDPLVFTACGSALGAIPSLPVLGILAEGEGLDMVGCAAPWWNNPPPNISATTDPLKIMELAAASSTDRIALVPTVFNDSRPYFGWFYRIGGAAPFEIQLPDDPHIPNAIEMLKLKASGAAIVLSNPSLKKLIRLPNSRWSFLKKSASVFGDVYPMFAGYGSELPYDLMCGAVDAIDIRDADDMLVWYNALNSGRRLTGIKSSAARIGSSSTDLPRPLNYVRLQGTPTRAGVVQAVTEGRVVVCEGPFIEFTVDNNGPGSQVAADGRMHYGALRIYAPVDGSHFIKRITLIRNGRILESTTGLDDKLSPGETIAARDFQITETESCWYIVMACDDTDRWSFTNPIYFRPEKATPPVPTFYPEEIALTVTAPEGVEEILVRVESGAEVLDRAAIKPGVPHTLARKNGWPPAAVLVLSAKGCSDRKVSLFGEIVFSKCLRNWAQARDSNPSLSDPLIFAELTGSCRHAELSLNLEPAGKD
ncbi:MAG: hypothetical protein WC712_12210, partial [Candidatus Brocadiia bacterium]